MTPDEVRRAEEDQVLDALSLIGPATVATIGDSMFPYESSQSPDGSYVIAWGVIPLVQRRARVRRTLERLRAAKLARVIPGSRSWFVTREGYTRAGFTKWASHQRWALAAWRGRAS